MEPIYDPNLRNADRILRLIAYELGKVTDCKIIIIGDCQDEPHLIASTPEEADEIIDMWEAGR
jgi:hypothetical protein